METSPLIRSLRFTFLTVGFLMFVIMAVHWVQHVSTARPVLTPKVIAVTPAGGDVSALLTSKSLQDASMAGLVQSQPSTMSVHRSTDRPTAAPKADAHQKVTPSALPAKASATPPHPQPSRPLPSTISPATTVQQNSSHMLHSTAHSTAR